MSAFCCDSSALVKRYVVETGTPWVQAITHPSARNRLIVARITWVEVLSALTRRQRQSDLTVDQVARSIRAFRYDWDTQYQVVDLDQSLTEIAGQMVRKHTLRAYDAVQMASALRIQPSFADATFASLAFVAADDQLLAAAQEEGLHIENPNHHL